jgi:hypothetical protein
LHQVEDELQNLPLNEHRLAISTQLEPSFIELEVPELKQHLHARRLCTRHTWESGCGELSALNY